MCEPKEYNIKMPPGLPKIIQSFSNVIATMTNPFSPLLFADIILDTFTFLIFILYRNIWIWMPALALWLFTALVYMYYAKNKPHLLSATVIQKYGMQLAAGLGEKGKPQIDEAKMLSIIPTTDPTPRKLEEGK